MNLLQQSCAKFTAYKEAIDKGMYPYYRAIESEQGTVVKINGKDILIHTSSNELGMVYHKN